MIVADIYAPAFDPENDLAPESLLEAMEELDGEVKQLVEYRVWQWAERGLVPSTTNVKWSFDGDD